MGFFRDLKLTKSEKDPKEILVAGIISLEDLLKGINVDSIRDQVVSQVVSELMWQHREKVTEMVDWAALTPTIQALATKDLAERVFSGMRR